jgi:ribulose-5-phosphate 4-epimerase/fuculose-1-phosphate aldolase
MYTTTRTELLEVCRLVYDRDLTNAAGSNFSARLSRHRLSDPNRQRETYPAAHVPRRSAADG